MEYVELHGTYEDIPVDKIVEAWEKNYGKDRVSHWIRMYEAKEEQSLSKVDIEEALRE